MVPLSQLLHEGLIWQAEPFFPSTAEKFEHLPSAITAGGSEGTSTREGLFVVPMGIAEIDSQLPHGGLNSSGIHECFFSGAPPLSLFTYMCGKALGESYLRASDATVGHPVAKRLSKSSRKSSADFNMVSLWIGKDTWPGPHFLKRAVTIRHPELANTRLDLIQHCLFADPRDEKEKLRILESALRSRAAITVVASCAKLSFALSRRLSLAAQQGNSLGIILRPNSKARSPSTAAETRWELQPATSETNAPRWKLTLHKVRGRFPATKEWFISLQDCIDEIAAPLEGVVYESLQNDLSFTLSPDPLDTNVTEHDSTRVARAS